MSEIYLKPSSELQGSTVPGCYRSQTAAARYKSLVETSQVHIADEKLSSYASNASLLVENLQDERSPNGKVDSEGTVEFRLPPLEQLSSGAPSHFHEFQLNHAYNSSSSDLAPEREIFRKAWENIAKGFGSSLSHELLISCPRITAAGIFALVEHHGELCLAGSIRDGSFHAMLVGGEISPADLLKSKPIYSTIRRFSSEQLQVELETLNSTGPKIVLDAPLIGALEVHRLIRGATLAELLHIYQESVHKESEALRERCRALEGVVLIPLSSHPSYNLSQRGERTILNEATTFRIKSGEGIARDSRESAVLQPQALAFLSAIHSSREKFLNLVKLSELVTHT